MKELGTKNSKPQNNALEGEQMRMGIIDSFAALFGSSPTLGEKRRARSEETPQRTSW